MIRSSPAWASCSPGAIGNDAFVQLMTRGDADACELSSGAIPTQQYEHLINARRTRRMSEYAKLCLAATSEAYRDAGIDDAPLFGETCAAIVATTYGATEYCETYYQQILDEGIGAANPDAVRRRCAQCGERAPEHELRDQGFFAKRSSGRGRRAWKHCSLRPPESARASGIGRLSPRPRRATELIATAYARLLARGFGPRVVRIPVGRATDRKRRRDTGARIQSERRGSCCTRARYD